MAPIFFTARDGRTYERAYSTTNRVAIKDHDGIKTGERLYEYWISESNDSERCYVAEDFTRHTLD